MNETPPLSMNMDPSVPGLASMGLVAGLISTLASKGVITQEEGGLIIVNAADAIGEPQRKQVRELLKVLFPNAPL